MKTLVIYVNSRPDTEFMFNVYRKLPSYTLLYNPSKSEVKYHLNKKYGRIIMLGHGDYYGLYNKSWNGYIVDASMIPLLKDKIVIGVWCYASDFAQKYDLHGFFTSMFISNYMELLECGFPSFDDCDEVIDYENNKFAETINMLINSNYCMDKWVNYFQEHCSDYNFVKYNYEALYYN